MKNLRWFEDEFENAEEEIFDPLSGYNSVMTEFNEDFMFIFWIL
ncbi:MAG: hypothetical protein Ct9H300mP28_37240 [Pseudomonadota bacterium]|nr:MAG: hypothetical protein Ct9H300mP28_37240 [Pseudomonadota bacterium]